MKNVLRFGILLTIFIFTSCDISPKAIDYGNDQCAACKMIISDARFGSELVTTKGRVYKYDAIECMVEHVIENGDEKFAHFLVTDFKKPGHLIEAKSAHYLISEKRPSPMGAFLSAYEDSKNLDLIDENKDLSFNWAELVEHFKSR